MAIIDIDHSLPGQHGHRDRPPQLKTSMTGRAPYRYLFQDFANRADAGIFPGTSPETTLQHIKDFEAAFGVPPATDRRMGLPAVYTYFGQFVNHDISAPVGDLVTEARTIPPSHVITGGDQPGLDKLVRPDTIQPILERIKNEQSRPLTLESLYAEGPESHDREVRDLYDEDGLLFRLAKTVHFSREQLERITTSPDDVEQLVGAFDIPRDGARGLALIADRRNDENLIVSQLHLAFMLLHNRAVDLLRTKFPERRELFSEARKLVTRHYQWCIVKDYLPKILSAGVIEKVLLQTPRLPLSNEVSMEFTTAAFRFGHSMVSQKYDFNQNFGIGSKHMSAATLQHLFQFTSRSGMANTAVEPKQLPDHWIADWDRLTKVTPDHRTGADRIDMSFAPGMLNGIPQQGRLAHASIFFRNIVRNFHRRIPFGQVLAEEGYHLKALSEAEVLSAMPDHCSVVAREIGIHKHTPAWLYFLCEAQVMEDGKRVGPTASHIIAETIIGLLKHNEESILGGSAWHPRESKLKSADGKPLDSLRDLMLYVSGLQRRGAA